VNGRRSADGKIDWDPAFHWLTGAAARPNDTTLELSGTNGFAFDTHTGALFDMSYLGKRG
jgi:hypothetical protein